MRVTAHQLRAMGACEDQIEIVEREWPRGVPITAPSIRKAARLGLDVWWFACQVLDGTALATYRAETAPALATRCDGTTETAWATYNAERAPVLVPLLRAALEAR